MRLLHVIEAANGDVGRHVLDLARVQADAGHDVLVLHGTGRESDAFRETRERLTGVQWHAIDVGPRPDTRDVRAVQTIRAVARGWRPDVIHGHAVKGGLLARSAPSGPWRIVHTPHAQASMDPRLSRRARSRIELVERKLAARTSAVIARSPEEEAHLRLIGLEPASIHLVPNGIPDLRRPEPTLVRRALGLPLDRPVLGHVGPLEERRSPHDLIAVFKEVAVARPRVDFAIIGDGPLRPEIEERVAVSPSLRNRVHLVDPRPDHWALAGLDALILASRYESLPDVLLLAARQGLPMVATRPSSSSLLQDGPAWLEVADLGDTAGLAGHCIRLVDDWPDGPAPAPDRRFTVEAMAALTELVYRDEPLHLEPREVRRSPTTGRWTAATPPPDPTPAEPPAAEPHTAASAPAEPHAAEPACAVPPAAPEPVGTPAAMDPVEHPPPGPVGRLPWPAAVPPDPSGAAPTRRLDAVPGLPAPERAVVTAPVPHGGSEPPRRPAPGLPADWPPPDGPPSSAPADGPD